MSSFLRSHRNCHSAIMQLQKKKKNGHTYPSFNIEIIKKEYNFLMLLMKAHFKRATSLFQNGLEKCITIYKPY